MPFASPHNAIGLNTDDDQAVMPPGDYRWLENGRVGKSQKENAGTVENILGMLELGGDEIIAQTRIVGWKYGEKSNEIYLLGGHANADSQAIYYVRDAFVNENPVVRLLVQNEHLGLSPPTSVWSIAISGDDLVYTTRDGEIRSINVPKAQDGGYDDAELEDVVLLRKGPEKPPSAQFAYQQTNEEDSLGEDAYQFAYRYIYDNNQYSVLSPWSKAISQNEDERNKNIWVGVSTSLAPNGVEKIEFLVKVNNRTEWQIIDEQTPTTSIFGNISTYKADVLGVTINNNDAYKIVDAIPRDVVALEFMKNRLFAANYVTGYALETVDEAVTGTIQIGDANTKVGFGYNTTVQLAIQFYDRFGRPSGALRGNKVSTGNLVNVGTDAYLSTIDWSINQNLEIPEWAYTYQILRTDDQRKSFFLQDRYIDGYYMLEEEDGTRIWGKAWTSYGYGWQYIMLDISLLNSSGIGYTYSDGDRIQFWALGNLYIKPIEFVDGRFVAIKSFVDIDGGFAYFDDGATENFQIFSPVGEENETTLHETGEAYSITNAGTSTRSFSTVNGTIENGDSHLVERGLAHYDTTIPPYDRENPYANDLVSDAGFEPRQAMNAFDDNYAVWVKGLGRATVAYESPGEQQSTTTVRYSEERIPDSTINNINKWNTLDRYDKIGEERTEIVKLTRATNVMIANHLRNTTSLAVSESFVSTADGSSFLAKTDNVIGDDRELYGGFGCVPETICEFEGRMWWADPYQNHIVRYTVNGTQSITDKNYKVERLFKEILKDYDWTNNSIKGGRIQSLPWAGYDPEFKEYFITFPGFFSGDPFQGTLAFSEETQRWVGQYDYKSTYLPDIYFRTKYKSYSALQQKVYEFHNEESPGYNNFFGQQYTRKLKLVVNPEAKAMKVWNNVWFTKIDLVSDAFSDPVVVLTNKYGQEAHIYSSDFINSEGIWKAPIYFDRNTSNMTASYAQRNGDRMRSEWIELETESDLTTLDAHVLTQVLWKQSEFTR